MYKLTTTILLITVVLVLLPTEAAAFGAGDIPDFSYLNGKAFRHGDIEQILLELVKSHGGRGGGGGGLLGFATSVLNAAAGGAKFNKDDVKRVYFGNWLRDYSQAMDIAGLSKLSGDTLVLIVWILGFLTFGFATEEFEVTAERLGVYLPVEHIDNPKGYAEAEGDARQFHPQLRPPVDERELGIDERTGMKNYMATEDQGWDTSTAFIRRTFQACIDHGRRSGGENGPDFYEALRLLGQGLHTLEDFTAHSNWCEIALRKLGHEEVFCHVGDNVTVQAPNGERVPPIVTGTFGGADFLHSLMGEATDHISQSSVTDLSDKLKNTNTDESTEALKALLSKLKSSGGDNDDEAQANQADNFQQKSKAYNFNPDEVMPPDVQKELYDVLKWRDGIYRDIQQKINMIPGLSDLLENFSNALNAYVYTVLAPYLTPILTQVTTVLGEGSKEIIDSKDQYEVFDDPDASDPTHSVLSKDHFQIILNECAGKVAQVVITHAVNLIVPAWSNDEDPNRVVDQILEAFHHPYYASGNSRIQSEMYDTMDKWIGGLGQSEGRAIIQQLTKESVREGKNKREGSGDENSRTSGGGSQSYGNTSGGGRRQEYGSGGGDSYGQRQGSGGQSEYNQTERRQGYSSGGYGDQGSYSSTNQSSGYGGGRDEAYGRTQTEESGYGRSRGTQEYSSESRTHYGREETSGNSYGSRNESSGYGGGRDEAYGRTRNEDSGHGRSRDNDEYSSGYGGNRSHKEESGYGGSRRHDEDSRETRQSGYGQESYGGGRQEQHSSYNPSYGQTASNYSSGRSQGYGESQEQSYAPSYSKPESHSYRSGGDSYSSRNETRGYGGGDSHSSSQESSGYGGNSYSSKKEDSDDEKPRHHKKHGHKHGSDDDNETYGAERLNLGEESRGYGSERRGGYGDDY